MSPIKEKRQSQKKLTITDPGIAVPCNLNRRFDDEHEQLFRGKDGIGNNG